MKAIILFTTFCFISLTCISQTNWDNVPVHNVKEAHLCSCCKYESNAQVDPKLWSDYLNWGLFLDSLKRTGIPEGIYKIPALFVIDTAGKVGLAKALENPHGLGNLVQTRINLFPYRWSPATQNGRPVKSYHRLIIVFDTRKNVEP